MRIDIKRAVLASGIFLMAAGLEGAAPKNVILFMGDGMGFEQVRAAGYYFNGAAGQFSFEQFSNFAAYTTHGASATPGLITDSAAGGSAIATGYKVENGNVSIAVSGGSDPRRAMPSDGRDLLTLLERFSLDGRSTGLVTNSYVTDATPAAFGAHHYDRYDSAGIASDYFLNSRPNVLFGSEHPGFTVADASAAQYDTVSNRAQLLGMNTESVTRVAGVFQDYGYAYDQQVLQTETSYDTNPWLWEMTHTALNVLDNNANGFFLMVENELTDSSAHSSGSYRLARNSHEVRELDRAVQQAINWAAGRNDTLILVAADHETGGLQVTANNGQGALPSVSWGTSGHSTAQVAVYASGANAHLFAGALDNTDLSGRVIAQTDNLERRTEHFQQGREGYVSTLDNHLRQADPSNAAGATTAVTIDRDDSTAAGEQQCQALIRFDDLFGEAENQIPDGAAITSAILALWTSNATGGNISVHEMLLDWSEQSTWNTMTGGINLGIDAQASAENTLAPPGVGAPALFDVTQTVQGWSSGGENLGWALLSDSLDGWSWYSSEYLADPTRRPALQITYVVPEPSLCGVIALAGLVLIRRR